MATRVRYLLWSVTGRDKSIAARVDERLRRLGARSHDTGWWRLTVDVPVAGDPKGVEADAVIRDLKGRGYRVGEPGYVAATRVQEITAAMRWLAEFLEREGHAPWRVIVAEGAKAELSAPRLRRARERLGCQQDASRPPNWSLPPLGDVSSEDDLLG